MTPHRAFFGEGDQAFALNSDQILELQRATGVGIGGLCQRVMRGAYGLEDLTHTLRLALIGGGLDPAEASALVTAYVPMMPLAKVQTLAVDVLHELMFGAELPADASPDDMSDEVPA